MKEKVEQGTEEVLLGVERTRRPVTVCREPPVRQSETATVDINRLMAAYDRSGTLPYVTEAGFYADVSEIGDYRDALERKARAEELFMQLPVQLRNRFENDPAAFLEYAADRANLPELRKLGLAVAEAVAAPKSAAERLAEEELAERDARAEAAGKAARKAPKGP